MKKSFLNHHRKTKQENCYQDILFKKNKCKETLFYRIKNVVEFPDIWNKVNRYKSNESKLPLTDGNIYFSSSNQNINLLEEVTFIDARPKFRIGAGESSMANKTIKLNIGQDTPKRYLLETGVIGGFEYWDGNIIDLPN